MEFVHCVTICIFDINLVMKMINTILFDVCAYLLNVPVQYFLVINVDDYELCYVNVFISVDEQF